MVVIILIVSEKAKAKETLTAKQMQGIKAFFKGKRNLNPISISKTKHELTQRERS